MSEVLKSIDFNTHVLHAFGPYSLNVVAVPREWHDENYLLFFKQKEPDGTIPEPQDEYCDSDEATLAWRDHVESQGFPKVPFVSNFARD